MQISKVMNRSPVTVYGGDTVQKAAEEMARSNHGLVVVLDNINEKKVIGVLSNKDIINKVIAKSLSPIKVFVSEVMTRDPISIDSEASTSDAMFAMRKYQIKRVLVIDNGTLQGIVTSNDILNEMVRYKKELLDMALDF